MPPLAVIEYLQVFKDSLPRLAVAGPVLPVCAFPFHGSKEALHQRIILAVAFATDAHLDPPRRKERLIRSADGLAAAVGMMEQSAFTGIPSRGVRRSLTSAEAASPIAFRASSNRLLHLAQGWTRSYNRSAKTLRGQQRAAEELANAEPKHHLTASTGNIVNRPLVLAVDMV